MIDERLNLYHSNSNTSNVSQGWSLDENYIVKYFLVGKNWENTGNFKLAMSEFLICIGHSGQGYHKSSFKKLRLLFFNYTTYHTKLKENYIYLTDK